ncbi:MAG: hypothetical protein WC659_01465 [Patescibacteria group bacterium]
MNLHHWSVNTEEFRKKNPRAYQKWALEQRINFGVQTQKDEKINETLLKQLWHQLTLDPAKKEYLELLLWDQPSSLNAKNNS